MGFIITIHEQQVVTHPAHHILQLEDGVFHPTDQLLLCTLIVQQHLVDDFVSRIQHSLQLVAIEARGVFKLLNILGPQLQLDVVISIAPFEDLPQLIEFLYYRWHQLELTL